MELTAKEKSYIKGLAHHLKPVIYIGKSSISNEVLQELSNTIKKHELIKVKIQLSGNKEKKLFANEIAKLSDTTLIQIIGKNIVLLKFNETNSKLYKKLKKYLEISNQ